MNFLKIENPSKFIKKLLFYFFLYMIFEGVLRKWFFPNYHVQIYFMKDFFLLVIYVLAFKYKFLFKSKFSIYATLFVILISIYGIFGYSFDTKNSIAYYLLGIRSYWLYFPLFLIIFHLITIEDVEKFFKFNVFTVIPYFLLIYLQSIAPDTSIINSGTNQTVFNPERPSGYFTFTTQNTFYFVFLSICFYYSLLNINKISLKNLFFNIFLCFLLFSVLIMLKSRAVYIFVLGALIYSVIFLIFSNEKKILKISKLLFIIVFMPTIFIICSKIFTSQYEFSVKRINTDTYYQMPLVKKYGDIGILGTRIKIANFCEKQSSICRIANEILFFSQLSDATIGGKGIGAGTAAVSAVKEEKNFTFGEAENHRIVHELGKVVGSFYVIFKYFFVILTSIYFIFKHNYKKQFSPILLFVSVQMLIGAVTFSVSFISFIFWVCLGIMLASFNYKEKYSLTNQ